jgi:hypothetical protein
VAKEMQLALASFSEWEKVSTIVENARLHKLAEEIGPKIERSRTLLLDLDETGLSYPVICARVRRHLLLEANKHCKTLEQMATTIGISRPQLTKWYRDFSNDGDVRALPIQPRETSRRPTDEPTAFIV